MALEEKARFRARMEELGEQQVRLLMSTGGLPMQLQPQILESLTETLWSSLAGVYPAGRAPASAPRRRAPGQPPVREARNRIGIF